MAFSYLGALLERQHAVFVLEEDEALLENGSLFLEVSLLFVPSLSWQMFGFRYTSTLA